MNFSLRHPIYTAIFLGLAITLIQIFLTCLLSDYSHPVEAYSHLYQWDSKWYAHIVENGYRSTIPPTSQNPQLSNVAFFPGYPIVVRAAQTLFNLPTPHTLLLTAQLACWGFWTYLVLFFQRWQVSSRLALSGIAAILAYPASFFLVAGYSESLFLMALLGFLYWTNYDQFSSRFLAIVHGFVMSATRIVGLPLALCLPFGFWVTSYTSGSNNLYQWLRNSRVYLLISSISALGSLLFFAFCYLEFGEWDLYMQTQLAGWAIQPDYLAIFDPKIYLLFINTSGLVTFLSRLLVPVTMALFLISWLTEWKLAKLLPENSWITRVRFYFGGWLIFYISVSGLSSIQLQSMSRYILCVHVMLVLAIVHLLSAVQPLPRIYQAGITFLLIFFVTTSFIIQSKLIYIFTQGKWVA